jgi:hypothetical protein
MYMLRRIFGKDFDNSSRSGSSLASSRITTFDKLSDRFPLTFRSNANKKGKNVWVYPSLPSDNVSGRDINLADSRITTESDMHLDSFPLTLRNSTNRKGKNVLIYPSLPSDDVNGRDSSLARPASTTASDINLDLSSPTLRSNSANKAGKNVVWVHPTP